MLTGNVWFSKFDANWAYLQVKVKDSDKEKTAFITKYGSFQIQQNSVSATHQVLFQG